MDIYRSVLSAADPRTEGWLLTSSLLYPLMFMSVHLWFSRFGGVELCLDCIPETSNSTFKKIMVVFNSIMLICNVCLGSGFSVLIAEYGYSFACQPMNYVKGKEDAMVTLVWWFHVVKILELLDCISALAASRQASATLYHHASMVLVSWLAVKYSPGGIVAIFEDINCWVHVALSIYYILVSTNRTSNTIRVLSIIQLQLMQFTLIITMAITALIVGCWPNKTVLIFTLIYVSTLLSTMVPSILRKYFNSQ